MVAKTREKLIEVARQLFIHKGVENTTISDIANASDKGRRTIYTYFKNKKEIYAAVIDRESDKIVSELRTIVDSDSTCAEKLRRFLHLRLAQSRLTDMSAYSSIKSLITFEGRRTTKIRRLAYEKENTILEQILSEGVAKGEFCAARCVMLNKFLLQMIQSTDAVPPSDEILRPSADTYAALIDFIVTDITAKIPE